MAKHILNLTFQSVNNYFIQVSYWLIFSIDKQVRLFVYYVQMDYFHSFLCQQADKQQTSCFRILCIYIYILKRKDKYIYETENGNNGKWQFLFVWLQTENRNGKLLFICCKRKWKLEIYFSWSANKKQYRNWR